MKKGAAMSQKAGGIEEIKEVILAECSAKERR